MSEEQRKLLKRGDRISRINSHTRKMQTGRVQGLASGGCGKMFNVVWDGLKGSQVVDVSRPDYARHQ